MAGMEDFKLKLKLLTDIIDRKAQSLSQILVITENQENMLMTTDKSDTIQEFFRETTAEKQKLIDEVLQADTLFQNIFDELGDRFEANANTCKDQIAVLQERIKEVTELDIKIRLQEQKNRLFVSKDTMKGNLKILNNPTPKISKNHLLEQYKKNKVKPKL